MALDVNGAVRDPQDNPTHPYFCGGSPIPGKGPVCSDAALPCPSSCTTPPPPTGSPLSPIHWPVLALWQVRW